MARVRAVACFHPADAGERVPLQVAGRPGLVGDQRGVGVGADGLAGDVGGVADVLRPVKEQVGGAAGAVDVDRRRRLGGRRRHGGGHRLQRLVAVGRGKRGEKPRHQRDHHHHRGGRDEDTRAAAPARYSPGC